MPEPNEELIRAFATSSALQKWLKSNHDSQTELWLKIFKKASGKKSITWEEAVVECLCWGWIDGVKKPLDEHAYLQRITPRRRKSQWSKRNREHVERLILEGRMQEPGYLHIRAAQSDGRWDEAYAPSSEMVIPEDFLVALESVPSAKTFYATLNRANLYAIFYRLHSAKKPETRQRRIATIINMLKNGEKFH